MRKLKTPDEIMGRAEILSVDVTRWTKEEIKLMIIAAQRDALECAGKYIKNHIYSGKINGETLEDSILNLIPKEEMKTAKGFKDEAYDFVRDNYGFLNNNAIIQNQDQVYIRIGYIAACYKYITPLMKRIEELETEKKDLENTLGLRNNS